MFCSTWTAFADSRDVDPDKFLVAAQVVESNLSDQFTEDTT